MLLPNSACCRSRLLQASLALACALSTLPLTHAAQSPLKVKVDSSAMPRQSGSLTSYAPTVAKVSPSVVSIYSRKLVTEEETPEEKFFREFFGGSGSPAPQEQRGLGSGVIVTEDGYILTNSHVVENADEVRVATAEGAEFDATVVGTDSGTDVALIKVQGTNLHAATLADSSGLRVGDVVLALGDPFGVGQTVTAGIVSATKRGGLGIEEYEDFIQIDAPINPGNSGGPLVDVNGRVVGLNTAIFSRTGGSIGIGFAVPINLARFVMDQISTQGRVIRGYLGASVQQLTPDLASALKAPSIKGALITGVVPNSPAAQAGLQTEDIVVSARDKPVDSSRTLRLLVAQARPGSNLDLHVLRDGQQKDITVKIGELRTINEPAGAQKPAAKAQPQKKTSFGMEVQELNRALRARLRVPSEITGPVITAIEPGGMADRAGLEPGDIIQTLDRREVSSARDVQSNLRQAQGQYVLLRVWSQGGPKIVALQKPASK